MTKFCFCLYLLDKIYHIKIISMMSWIVIMLLLTLPKAIQTRPGGQNIIWYFDPLSRYFDPPPPPPITDDTVLFVFHIYLQNLSLYQNYINDFLSSYNAFILTLPKAIPTWPRGQIIVRYFDPPRYFDPAQIINYKVLFVFHIYLIIFIIILKLY